MPDVSTLLLRTFSAPVELRTPRVLLRQWKEGDHDEWGAMNADTEVRQYFPAVNDQATSQDEMTRCRAGITQRGWGFWALEIPGVDAFAGFVGLNSPAITAPWQPAVEIGWRLKRSMWGKGYATEAATAALHFAFTSLELPFVMAMSVSTNTPSHKVMKRIGMCPWPGMEFDHPRVPADWPLKRHIVHRITREDWARQQS
jgi:RimJ/RimL family protein N-acetyltransferase